MNAFLLVVMSLLLGGLCAVLSEIFSQRRRSAERAAVRAEIKKALAQAANHTKLLADTSPRGKVAYWDARDRGEFSLLDL